MTATLKLELPYSIYELVLNYSIILRQLQSVNSCNLWVFVRILNVSQLQNLFTPLVCSPFIDRIDRDLAPTCIVVAHGCI